MCFCVLVFFLECMNVIFATVHNLSDIIAIILKSLCKFFLYSGEFFVAFLMMFFAV